VHTMEEDIEFKMLLKPKEFLGNERLEKAVFRKIAIEKEKFVDSGEDEAIEADVCVLAVGQDYDASIANKTEIEGKEIKINGVKTELWGIFAAGDLANKEKTVVHSVASAKKAAEEIEKYVMEKK